MNIVITGASRGLGFETARILAGDRANRVFAVSRSPEGLERLTDLCRNDSYGGKLMTCAFDVARDDIRGRLVPAIEAFLGKVDTLINNAAAMVNKSFEHMTLEDFDDLFTTNVKSPFFLSQSLLPIFSEGAHIVNIGSMGGFQGSVKFPGLSLYSASKGALAVISECLAVELSERRISANCLAIGSVQTEMLSQAFPGYKAPLSASEMAVFLAEFALRGHKWFNGKVLPVSVSIP